MIAEFATQDRFYPERGDLAAELRHMGNALGADFVHVIGTSRDYGRPIVVFSKQALDFTTAWGSRVLLEGLGASFRRLPRSLARRARSAVSTRCDRWKARIGSIGRRRAAVLPEPNVVVAVEGALRCACISVMKTSQRNDLAA